jgi:hypothetical protein
MGGKARLHEQWIDEFVKRRAERDARVSHLAGGKLGQQCLGLGRRQRCKLLLECLSTGGIRRYDPDFEELFERQRQLMPKCGLPLRHGPRT